MKEKDNFEITINLRRAIMGKRNVRARRAINIVRETVKRHFNAERVVLDPLLNQFISTNGREKIQEKITIVVTKLEEKTFLVRLVIKSE
ncbi:50S ribosomal protein L31e [Sulfuracidifex metallicus]|uniref:Large ribosomal subunit protein eL31 n=1 Tax=Sulfuracidifex metallicus DSM 6482 = JCM 9184 TaxID=523847 RepID=A0A6A9QIS4_SULME|nr:50S ribosomal protein L31e [Sulfuracidifex metallicus]MUN28039.1 50S ribosomal protein L31e [Sulfuracidifex metallicus DSM 6482 = JCM 9184]WOE51414.1 50S ribosomal protein L31e [Sulfuracidifex metallicus DSM 6482 = JCM 9184]